MWPRDANSPRPEPRHWSGFAKRMPFPLLRLGFPCPRPKDGRGDEDGGGNFHGQQRKNDTHASTSDPDSRLYRKAAGREAKLCYMGHATRAMTECIFGWGKQHGTMRKTKHRGIASVAADFMLNPIAYNLIRILKPLAA